MASWVSGFRVQRSNSWESLPAIRPSRGLQVIALLLCVLAAQPVVVITTLLSLSVSLSLSLSLCSQSVSD